LHAAAAAAAAQRCIAFDNIFTSIFANKVNKQIFKNNLIETNSQKEYVPILFFLFFSFILDKCFTENQDLLSSNDIDG
jgi:hypothetical protein